MHSLISKSLFETSVDNFFEVELVISKELNCIVS